MEEYTKEKHVDSLLLLLGRENPCHYCPVILSNKTKLNLKCCDICLNFIGLSLEMASQKCPCYRLGFFESIKRTWLALEAGGYLD